MNTGELQVPNNKPEPPHVVMIVHGIRDHAEWQRDVERELRDAGVIPVSVKFGFFNALQFLCPPYAKLLSVISRKPTPLERVSREFKLASQFHNPQRFSVIAHSFGTYIVSEILQEETTINYWRIIFCGSVVNRDFRWDSVKDRIGNPFVANKREYIVNDCGSSDHWPAMAEIATLGYLYGAAGTDGFGAALVQDRFHTGGHGYFLTADFVEKYWKPFIVDGTYVDGEGTPGADLPKRIRWLQYLLSKTALFFVYPLVLLAAYFVYQFFFGGPPHLDWEIEEYLRRRAKHTAENTMADFEKQVIGHEIEWDCKVIGISEQNKNYRVGPVKDATRDQIRVRFKDPAKDFDRSLKLGSEVTIRGEITGVQGNVTRVMDAEIAKKAD